MNQSKFHPIPESSRVILQFNGTFGRELVVLDTTPSMFCKFGSILGVVWRFE